MSNSAVLGFFWYDYIIFIVVLLVSTAIGIYYGCFGNKQKTISEYLLGNNKMRPFPIAVSIAIGHISAILIIIIPAEIYKYGAFYWWTCLSMIIMAIVSIYIYLPVFFNLKITSTYEYLERRFDKRTRLLASFLYILFEITFLPMVAYTPALALAAATGLEVSVIVTLTFSICVFYTAIGGLKGVVWTDLFQLLIIIASLACVSVIGVNSEGGFTKIWKKALDGKRLDIFDFDLNPTKRDSFWVYIIGLTLIWVKSISLSQAGVQKFLALPKFCDIVWAMGIFVVCNCLIISFSVLMGFLLYSKYSDCDPYLDKKIKKQEQLVPFYIMDIAGHIPGVSGTFLVALFCAALSTLSSSLNALSGVIYKDFVTIFLKHSTERRANLILKLSVVVSGAACIGIVLLVQHSGDLFPLIISLTAISDGPTVGIFTLGVLFPKANAKGAFYGTIGGFIAVASLVLPTKFLYSTAQLNYVTKPLSVENCVILNETASQGSDEFSTIVTTSAVLPPFIFRISHFYHCLIGAVVTILLGLIISRVTKEEDCAVEKSLISPVCHFLLPKHKQICNREMSHLINQ